jgi:MoaA/NifB/PqqE/SkfB family radical SAM enzyme
MTLSQSLRSLLKKPRFDVLTLFVTNRCNARCASCFYWQELNSCVDLLSLEDYRLIAASMPPFEKLLLSGGEPTLEPTLPDVVDLFLTRPEQALVSPPTASRRRSFWSRPVPCSSVTLETAWSSAFRLTDRKPPMTELEG